jgi:hypothetical protein
MTAEYTLSPETPTAVQADSAVTLATVTDGAAISYTTDNSDPAASGTKTTYTAGTPITLSAGTTTVKAVATKANWANSAVFSKDFTYTVGSANPPPSGGDSDPLTSVVYYSATANATTAGDLSNTSGTQAAPVWNLNVTEEPAVYFEIEKSAAQTITVGGADAAKVTKITEGSLDGTTASDTVDLFSVNMEDLLFNGAFGGSTDGSTIPSGTETRTFTLTVSEPSHTSRVITMTLDLSLDADTDTTIYHRKGEPGNYHYVKVRDAELGEDDKTNYATATSPAFSALTVGPVTDLQNAFVWVDHHGVAGDATTGATGYANGTTEGYSEYRLFVKKNQQIGKINVKFLNSKPQVDDYSMTYDTDLRNYISIELYGAGSPGGRENRITHDDSFSTTLDTQVFNHNAATSEGGLIGLAPSSTYGVGDREQWEMIQKHKALVLEKNITLAGNGSSVPMGAPDFSNPNNKWTTLAISYLIDVRQNSMVIMRNHAKVTDFYGVFAPINLATDSDISGKFYMYGGAITGNTFTGGSQSLVRGGTANTNMFLLGGDTTTGNVFN